MNALQARLKAPDRVVNLQSNLEIGDRVKIAGISQHTGEVVAVRNNNFSGLTYSVKIGECRLDGVNPLALTKLC